MNIIDRFKNAESQEDFLKRMALSAEAVSRAVEDIWRAVERARFRVNYSTRQRHWAKVTRIRRKK